MDEDEVTPEERADIRRMLAEWKRQRRKEAKERAKAATSRLARR
ncbi:hypothetical protein [Vannielia sp.]